MRQVAAALTAIHAAGICHRDIKPANILVGRGDVVKVTDFGVARLPGSCLTVTRQIIGSPSYLSPEACAARPVDHRADLFSLGVVGYELLTGQHPFRGETVAELLDAIPNVRPLAPRKLRPEIPSACQRLLGRLLRKDPEERYQTAREVVAAIDALLADEAKRPGPWELIRDWRRSDWR
jgi:serine/threonine-protein kinase